MLHQKKECGKVQELQERHLRCSEVCPAWLQLDTVPMVCKQFGCHLQVSDVRSFSYFLPSRNMTKQKAAFQESTDALTELW